jgi:hypothetical protein
VIRINRNIKYKRRMREKWELRVWKSEKMTEYAYYEQHFPRLIFPNVESICFNCETFRYINIQHWLIIMSYTESLCLWLKSSILLLSSLLLGLLCL